MAIELELITSKTVLVKTTQGFRVRHYQNGECDMESGLIRKARRNSDGQMELLVDRKSSKGDPRLWRFEVEPDFRFGLTELVTFTSNFGIDLFGANVNV